MGRSELLRAHSERLLSGSKTITYTGGFDQVFLQICNKDPEGLRDLPLPQAKFHHSRPALHQSKPWGVFRKEGHRQTLRVEL